jgi:hypothetical protein
VETTVRRIIITVAATLVAGTASASVPLFAAKCPTGITVDSNTNGQVYVNGKVAKLTPRPGGQVTAQSAGIYIDITPQGSEPPLVSYTAPNKANGMCKVVSFKPPGGAAAASGGGQREPSSARAGQGKFDATGQIPCAQRPGQPMTQCNFGVARDGGGSATVVVTRPDGRTRAIFFEKGKAVGADLSQADGNMDFKASKNADLYVIQAGDERYEIPEAVVYGG